MKGRAVTRRVIANLKHALRILGLSRRGQLTREQERELIVYQILRLLERGLDQFRIRRLLVGEGLTSSRIFDEAWLEAIKEYRRKRMM